MKRFFLTGLVALLVLIAPLCASIRTLAQSSSELDILDYQNNYEEMIKKAPELLKADPDNPRLNMYLGKALCITGHYAEAMVYLQKADELLKAGGQTQNDINTQGWAKYYLSRCHWQFRNYEGAKALLEECLKMTSEQEVVNNALTLYRVFGFTDYYKDWTVIESEHFVFHFANPSDVKDIAAFITEHEETFQRVNRFFNSKVPRKVDCFIYNSLGDILDNQSYRGGLAYGGLCVIHLMYLQSSGHEMTHVIAYYCSDSITIAPLIGEGTAVYFTRPYVSQLNFARKIMQERGISSVSIKDLWTYWTSTVPDDLAYSVAGAFVEYLIDKEGESKYRQLLMNQTYENAKTIYGERLDQLIAEFEKLLI